MSDLGALAAGATQILTTYSHFTSFLMIASFSLSPPQQPIFKSRVACIKVCNLADNGQITVMVVSLFDRNGTRWMMRHSRSRSPALKVESVSFQLLHRSKECVDGRDQVSSAMICLADRFAGCVSATDLSPGRDRTVSVAGCARTAEVSERVSSTKSDYFKPELLRNECVS